jgi:hypothetical protein
VKILCYTYSKLSVGSDRYHTFQKAQASSVENVADIYAQHKKFTNLKDCHLGVLKDNIAIQVQYSMPALR